MSPSTIAEALPVAAGSDTRSRLIVAAVHLFQQRGFHGIGTAEILARAEATRGSLYHHFPGGKAELGAAAAAWLAEQVVRRIQRLRLDGLAPHEVIADIASATADWLRQSDYAQSGLLSALCSGLQRDDAAVGEAVRTAIDRIEGEYSHMLRTAGVDPTRSRDLAGELVVAFEGALIIARAKRDAGIVALELGRIAQRIKAALRDG